MREICAVMCGSNARAVPAHGDLKTYSADGLSLFTAPAIPPQKHARAEALVERQRMLEALLANGDVLAAMPGTAIRDDEIEPFIGANGTVLRAVLTEIAGLVQHQITVRWPPEAALLRFADAPEFAGSALAVPPTPRAIASSAEALRERLAREQIATIAESVNSLQRLPTNGPEMVLNIVVAGHRDNEALEAALERIDNSWPEGWQISMVGPLPPLSFAALSIERPNRAELRAARRLLGMPDCATVDEATIRDAFVAAARRGQGACRSSTGASLTAARDLLMALARQGCSDAGSAMIARIQRGDAASLDAAPRNGGLAA